MIRTQSSYVQQAAAFARHFHKSPELLGPEDIRTYQVYLTHKGLSASSLTVVLRWPPPLCVSCTA